MERLQARNGLHFNQNYLGHNQVHGLSWNLPVPVFHQNSLLTLERNLPRLEFQAERAVVDDLLESRPKFPVDGDRTPNRCTHDLFVFW
jgi:hypothetical protein